MAKTDAPPGLNFIRNIVAEDLKTDKWGGRVHSRFPPEPNGYLHIGHAKSICLNFGIAEEYGGLCNLRFDDTNPLREEVEYVESIKEDVRWLGFDWNDREFYASDYFEPLYQYAEQLIEGGKAYVCDLSPEEIREYQAIQFPLTKARFFRLDYLIQVYFGCSGLGCSASMREVQFYGRGFLPEVVMESELIELGSRPRTLVTIDWDAEIPEGTQLQVRTRSGNQLEQKIHYYNKSGGEVTEKQYRKLLSFQRGDSLVTSIPGTDWSPWSQYYQAPGARITSPSPRRYTMIQAALVSARPDRAVRLRSLAVQLEDPLVSRLVGEISPGRVSKAGEEELFTLYLHPFFQRGDAGFDQLLIEIPQGAELSLLDVAIGPESDHRDGTARRLNIDELTLTETGTDSLWIALPEIVEGTTEELVALRFATLLFQPGNVFGVSAGLQDGGKIVWQRADQGNATQLEKNNSLTVLTSFKEKIIHDLQVRPNPFTPNRDGINDLQTFAFSVFKINVEKSLFLEIYALSGQLLQRLNKNVTNPVGEQRLEWNGRDTAGNLVPPGMYICRVGLQVDTASQATATATQVIAVVY